GAGASAAAALPDGTPPLWLATRHGHIDIVRRLLAHGADPALRGPDGRTPLEEARARHLEAIAALLERAR
ncbi:MAG: ankyrin repeat domain-containing protein, partial [Proteobacteria bacterium]|nr:ankyrin repeat domain-containing protein [Pseudomonadota bacterium]